LPLIGRYLAWLFLSCSVLLAVPVAVTVAAPMVDLGSMAVVVGVVLCVIHDSQ